MMDPGTIGSIPFAGLAARWRRPNLRLSASSSTDSLGEIAATIFFGLASSTTAGNMKGDEAVVASARRIALG